MSDFGIQTYRPNGSVSIDSSNKAGVFLESMVLAHGASGSKVYPDVPAGYLYHVVVDTRATQFTQEIHVITVGDDGTGQAKISWTGIQYDGSSTTTVLVFARRTNAVGGSFGAAILSANGDYLADLKYSVPQFNGVSKSVLFQERVQNPHITKGVMYRCRYAGENLGVSNKLFFLNLPDSSVHDLWYALSPYDGINKVPTVYVHSPAGIHPNGTYNIPWPSMHEFDLGAPVSAGSSFGLQCFNASSALTYDSSAENLTLKEVVTVVTPPRQTYSWDEATVVEIPISFSGEWGVSAPFFSAQYFNDFDNMDSSTVEYWLSLYQRKGNTLRYKVMLMRGTKDDFINNATYGRSTGTPKGGGILVADISQLNPAPSIIYTGY